MLEIMIDCTLNKCCGILLTPNKGRNFDVETTSEYLFDSTSNQRCFPDVETTSKLVVDSMLIKRCGILPTSNQGRNFDSVSMLEI